MLIFSFVLGILFLIWVASKLMPIFHIGEIDTMAGRSDALRDEFTLKFIAGLTGSDKVEAQLYYDGLER